MSSKLLPELRTYCPPVEDGQELATLKAEVRAKLDLLLRCMATIQLAPQKKAAYERLATELRGYHGLSASTLKRDFRAFRASGYDWRVLVPDYNRPDKVRARGLPAEFLTEWRRRAENNQRCAAPAYRDLLRDWKAGVSIPGYGTWREWYAATYPTRRLPATCPTDKPPGWSYNNLLNKLASGAEITVLRDGFFAAHSLLPQIQRDRSQLRFLEVVAFDDFQTDFRVAVPSLGQVCKLIGLAAQCIGSAVVVQHAVGASIKDDDDHRRGIIQADMRLTLHTLFAKYGLPRDYTQHLLVENATAAITEPDELLITRITAGRTKIIRTAMHEAAALPGGWAERFGSPQQKGWIEAVFNLFHNEAAALPGQFGLNQLEGKTGTIDKLTKEAEALYKAAKGLPEDILRTITTGLLTEEQARVAVQEIFNRINNRDSHKLQGFAKITRWRLRDCDEWLDLASLPPELRDVPGLQIKDFIETPIERMVRLLKATRFDAISPIALIPLLNEKRLVKVKRPYQIEITHKGQRRLYHLQDERLRLEGTPFVAVYDERDMSCLHLHDEGMAYKCTAPVFESVPVLDAAALDAAVEKSKRAQAALLSSLRARHADDARSLLANREEANALIADAAVRLSQGRDSMQEATQAEDAAMAMIAAQQATKAAIAKQEKRSARRREAVDTAEAELLRAAAEQNSAD